MEEERTKQADLGVLSVEDPTTKQAELSVPSVEDCTIKQLVVIVLSLEEKATWPYLIIRTSPNRTLNHLTFFTIFSYYL